MFLVNEYYTDIEPIRCNLQNKISIKYKDIYVYIKLYTRKRTKLLQKKKTEKKLIRHNIEFFIPWYYFNSEQSIKVVRSMEC